MDESNENEIETLKDLLNKSTNVLHRSTQLIMKLTAENQELRKRLAEYHKKETHDGFN